MWWSTALWGRWQACSQGSCAQLRQPSPQGARHHGDLHVLLRREPAELWAALFLSEQFFPPGNEKINLVMVGGGWSCEGDVHKALCMVPRSSRVSNLFVPSPLILSGPVSRICEVGIIHSYLMGLQCRGNVTRSVHTLAHTGELCLPQGLRKVIP